MAEMMWYLELVQRMKVGVLMKFEVEFAHSSQVCLRLCTCRIRELWRLKKAGTSWESGARQTPQRNLSWARSDESQTKETALERYQPYVVAWTCINSLGNSKKQSQVVMWWDETRNRWSGQAVRHTADDRIQRALLPVYLALEVTTIVWCLMVPSYRFHRMFETSLGERLFSMECSWNETSDRRWIEVNWGSRLDVWRLSVMEKKEEHGSKEGRSAWTLAYL